MHTLLSVDQLQRCNQLRDYLTRPVPRSRPLLRHEWIQKNADLSDLSRLQRSNSTAGAHTINGNVTEAALMHSFLTPCSSHMLGDQSSPSDFSRKNVARIRSANIKLRNGNKTLRRTIRQLRVKIQAMIVERDAVLKAWSDSVSSIDFGLECVFANDLTHEQYSNLRNLLANEYDEASNRHKRKRLMSLKGIGDFDKKNLVYFLLIVVISKEIRCTLSPHR